MAAPGSVLDGSPGYGCRVLTLSTTGAWLAEQITPSRPVTIARDRKHNGEPGRSRYTSDFASFTCVLQSRGATVFPIFGETTTLTLDDNYPNETWIAMQPEPPLSNDPSVLNKINITFQKKNCLTVTTVAALPAAD